MGQVKVCLWYEYYLYEGGDRTVAAKKQHKTSLRKHEVKADLHNFELAKAKSSLNLEIYAEGEKIGELEVGRGF